MFRKILFPFTLLQLCCVSLSFESDFRELAPRLSNYKTNGDFTEIDVKLIQAFFNNFRQELDSVDTKKMYMKLNLLSSDTRRFVSSKMISSHKDINKFIANGLQLIGKDFSLTGDIETFIENYNENSDFLTVSNVVDEEMFKSRDWKSRKVPKN